MDIIKKLILFRIPMSKCNFRCDYCYLAQRPKHYEGIQPEMKYTPGEVAYALRKERIGGPAYLNFCADGETLLTKDIDLYIKALVEQGHYAEIVSNMTITPMIDKILKWEPELLERIEFKCSFHYLELKSRNLLDIFASNIKRVWEAGSSANIEITPSDELIPYLDEVKEFSLKKFGALPHITIARNDSTKGIEYLTNLPMEEYDRIWGSFDSGFWKFKKTIFGLKQSDFCYAGKWGLYVDLTNGMTTPCYYGKSLGDIFANPNEPLPESAIGRCPIAHCYNGHMLLTLGYIPHKYSTKYGDIRDREKLDGAHWLRPQIKAFFNSKLEDSNEEYYNFNKKVIISKRLVERVVRKIGRTVKSRK